MRTCFCFNLYPFWLAGDLEKVCELISGLALGPEEESPYEALFEATSCHSLDSLTSGKSSDRDSGRPDSEAGKVSSFWSVFFIYLFFNVFSWNPSHSYTYQDRVRHWNAELPLEGDGDPLFLWQCYKNPPVLLLLCFSVGLHAIF